jgi:hypothetical protein
MQMKLASIVTSQIYFWFRRDLEFSHACDTAGLSQLLAEIRGRAESSQRPKNSAYRLKTEGTD